ncbi:hypothetical protein GP5015_419 [gamma proteobacterium HTCC5015]|nr:hypothetical protein GP5015_419 [gamma proteobacterium HTCC5015]
MSTNRISRAMLALLLVVLITVSLYGVWGHWQLRQAQVVLRDLSSGKRQAATTHLVERADKLARIERWWPTAQRYRGMLLEWSATSLEPEQRQARWQQAFAHIEQASQRMPASGFVAVDELRLALKLGLKDGQVERALAKIDRRAPNNVQIHHSALKLLYTPQLTLSQAAREWRQRELVRVSKQPGLAWRLLREVRDDGRGVLICLAAPQESELASRCRQAKLLVQ